MTDFEDEKTPVYWPEDQETVRIFNAAERAHILMDISTKYGSNHHEITKLLLQLKTDPAFQEKFTESIIGPQAKEQLLTDAIELLNNRLDNPEIKRYR